MLGILSALLFLAPEISSAWMDVLCFICLTCLVFTTVSVCNTLTEVYNLSRQEHRITLCQIFILVAVGIWIIGGILIFDIQKDSKSTMALGIVGSIFAIIFQDKIKGALTFINLRHHNLLKIGDWIKVPKLDVDGDVKAVSLTTVTLYNRDNTTSILPISALQSEHFINLQNMSDGKTYGRRMLKTLTLSSSCVHPVTKEEIDTLMTQHKDLSSFLSAEDLQEGMLNARLYRLYLYRWLMANPHVSQVPNLMVRWVEQNEYGLTLQVYAYLLECKLGEFEWRQSLVFEHMIASLEWFGLKLYQSPASFDVNDVHLINNNSNEE